MTSFLNNNGHPSLDTEVSRLRRENRAILDELAQCQTDKEFVWSLWKRLQVANPDITQAIGMVVQREKEKCEPKDQKVMEILRQKDARLEELQAVVASHAHEAGNLNKLKLELQSDVNRLKNENDSLQEQCVTYRRKLQESGGEEREIGSREAIREMDKEILELKQCLSRRDKDLSDLQRDREDLATIKAGHRDRIQTLEHDLKDVNTKYRDLLDEHGELKQKLKRYENEMSALERQIDDKDAEIYRVRDEMSEVWQTHTQTTDHTTQQANLIRQLQGLQHDTQRMMKNQEDAFEMETKTLQSQLVAAEAYAADLQRQLEQLGVTGVNKRSFQTNVRYAVGDKESQNSESETDVENRIESLQGELNSLRGQMSRSRPPLCDRASSPLRSAARSRSQSRDSRPRSRSPALKKHSRSRSEPRSRLEQGNDGGALQKRLHIAERKSVECEELLRIKNTALEEIKSAHGRRLERLRSLQSNYRLLKKQLRLVEEQNGTHRKRRRVPRADPKSLQREDSDKVWNELTHFRNETRNLTVEKMNLQEEVDLLRVQTAQDSATIYELRSCLDQEREELEFLTEQQKRHASPAADLEGELKTARKEIKRLQRQAKKAHEDNSTLTADRERTLIERRDMKMQINTLKQKDAEYRMKIADLNRDIGRLHREIRKKRRQKGRTAIGKQFQRTLNQSIRSMRDVFDDFPDKDWEEVSDTEETQGDDTVTTADSLGRVIAAQADMSLRSEGEAARQRVRPTRRQKDSVTSHIHRIATREASPQRPTARREQSPACCVRDVALSPIHFLAPQSPRRPTVTVATSPHVVSKKGRDTAANSNAVIRQVAALKQRVHSLQQQISLLRQSREAATHKCHSQRDALETLEAELSSTNQKLSSSRLLVQRLTSDLERLRGDRELLEQRMETRSLETSVTVETGNTRTEGEWAGIQARLKTASSEVSKQLTQIKSLKAESSEHKDRIQQLQDRVSHLERDVSQKRTLLEDMKVKMRFAQENAQTDAAVMTEVEGKLKSLSETNSRYKSQVESFRNRLSAVTKQKYDSEDKVGRLSQELERKSRQASEFQRKNTELQSAVVAIEKTAQQQLHALANQSEAAIDGAQSKLSQANTKLQEHDKFVKVFTHALVNSLQQARSLCQQQKQRKKATPPVANDVDPSLRQAQSLACDILNLSQSDIDDIMSNNGAEREDKLQPDAQERLEDCRRDKKWSKKVEKTTQKVEFALPLTELIMEKMEERNKLAAKLQAT